MKTDVDTNEGMALQIMCREKCLKEKSSSGEI